MSSRSLFAVVFEARPNPARADEYLQIAGSLRAQLADLPGFLENERFKSRSRDGYLLSLSLWDHEKALVQWRTMAQHHAAQVRGREGVLDDYRIRVGEVTRVAGRYADRPVGWARQDHTDAGPATTLTIIDGELSSAWLRETEIARPGLVDRDVFDHLSMPGRVAALMGWRTPQHAEDFASSALLRCDKPSNIYAIRVIRDYGLMDRREAPQYYPPAAPGRHGM